MESIKLPQATIAQHIIACALEYGEYDEYHIDGDVKWSLEDLDVEDVFETKEKVGEDEYEYGVVVFGRVEGTQSRQTHSATRHHDAEYETEDVLIGVELQWFPHRNSYLGGVDMTAYQETYPFAAPDSEDGWRDI